MMGSLYRGVQGLGGETKTVLFSGLSGATRTVEFSGLGADLYDPTEGNQWTLDNTSDGRWVSLMFGQQPVSADQQKALRNRIIEVYGKVLDAGLIDYQDYQLAYDGAIRGLLITPAGPDSSDKYGRAAHARMLEATGLKELRRSVITARGASFKDEAAGLAAEIAALDKVYTGLYYISGSAALDKLNDKWNELLKAMDDVSGLQQEARSNLDDQGYERVNAALAPIGAEIDRLGKYVDTSEVPGLSGAPLVIAIVAVSVALVVIAIALAVIYSSANRARNIYAQEQKRILDAKLAVAASADDIAQAEKEYNDSMQNLPKPGATPGVGIALGGIGLAVAAGLALFLVMKK